jgi:hypothetical protein
MPGPITKYSWPEQSTQPPNLVEVMTTDDDTTYAEHGTCQETWHRVPKHDWRTGRAIGTEVDYGHRPCGQPGLLTALTTVGDDDYQLHPVYTCPDHS